MTWKPCVRRSQLSGIMRRTEKPHRIWFRLQQAANFIGNAEKAMSGRQELRNAAGGTAAPTVQARGSFPGKGICSIPIQTLWGNGIGKRTNLLIRQKWHRHQQKKYGGLENAATAGRLHPKTGYMEMDALIAQEGSSCLALMTSYPSAQRLRPTLTPSLVSVPFQPNKAMRSPLMGCTCTFPIQSFFRLLSPRLIPFPLNMPAS